MAVSEHPILFTGPMIRSILDGRKTMTRRVVKPQPPVRGAGMRDHKMALATDDEGENLRVYSQSAGSGSWSVRCPYGQPGDRLWVKEAITRGYCGDMNMSAYAADDSPTKADAWPWKLKTLPAMFCPYGLSRIMLEITGVRVERLQEIGHDDARAEGVRTDCNGILHLVDFRQLWDDINAKRAPWASNPFVWVIEFRMMK